MQSHGVTSRKKWIKLWEFFKKIFLKFEKNFFKIFTTVYKAGLSRLED